MISHPKNGWCNFQIDDFTGSPSYLTDVPMELLDAFVEFYCDRKFAACINFDEEGSEFYLVLTANGAYIIEEREEVKLITLNTSIRELAEELMDDISENLTAWAKEFSVDVGISNNPLNDMKIIKERVSEFKSKIKLLQETFDNYDKDREKREEEITNMIESQNVYNKNDYLVIQGKEEGKKEEEEDKK